MVGVAAGALPHYDSLFHSPPSLFLPLPFASLIMSSLAPSPPPHTQLTRRQRQQQQNKRTAAAEQTRNSRSRTGMRMHAAATHAVTRRASPPCGAAQWLAAILPEVHEAAKATVVAWDRAYVRTHTHTHTHTHTQHTHTQARRPLCHAHGRLRPRSRTDKSHECRTGGCSKGGPPS